MKTYIHIISKDEINLHIEVRCRGSLAGKERAIRVYSRLLINTYINRRNKEISENMLYNTNI